MELDWIGQPCWMALDWLALALALIALIALIDLALIALIDLALIALNGRFKI